MKNPLTISASWYSSKTSKVERKVPLRIVGSSEVDVRYIGNMARTLHARGMIVKRLLKSVSPILAMSMPSTIIRPSVASTKRKKESASVLFPLPIQPFQQTIICAIQIVCTCPAKNSDPLSWIDSEGKVVENIGKVRLI